MYNDTDHMAGVHEHPERSARYETKRREAALKHHDIHDASKRALQWYSKYYCVTNVTNTFILEGVQTIHPSAPRTRDNFHAFKYYKPFLNTRQTVTFGISL
jgi:hypothetical protein